MAEIFLATERGRAEPLVIKRVLPSLSEDPRFVEMLLGEAKVASLLDHPGIVRIHELGREAKQVYLAMEYVPGWNLEVVCEAAGGRIPPPVAARIALAVAEALAHAHRQKDLQGRPLKLVHRDVTPANVMVTPAGEVKLIDFGIAKAATQLSLTAPGVVKGKLRFMSPEQARRQPLDGRSDLYSLGVTLYELTTGERPFERKSVAEVVEAVASWDPPRPRQYLLGYPDEVEQVVLKALEKDPDERFPDAEAMARALALSLSGAPLPDIGAFVRDLAAQQPAVLPALLSTDVDDRACTTPAAILSEAIDDPQDVTTSSRQQTIPELAEVPTEPHNEKVPRPTNEATTKPGRALATRSLRPVLGEDGAATVSESKPGIGGGQRRVWPWAVGLGAAVLGAAGVAALLLLGR